MESSSLWSSLCLGSLAWIVTGLAVLTVNAKVVDTFRVDAMAHPAELVDQVPLHIFGLPVCWVVLAIDFIEGQSPLSRCFLYPQLACVDVSQAAQPLPLDDTQRCTCISK